MASEPIDAGDKRSETMKEIVADQNLVAKCGLYCGACKRYLNDKCPGCAENEKASWCGVRKCTLEQGYASCADCTLKPIEECKEFNSLMARLFGFIFRSDRKASITRIKQIGPEAYAREMTAANRMSIRR